MEKSIPISFQHAKYLKIKIQFYILEPSTWIITVLTIKPTHLGELNQEMNNLIYFSWFFLQEKVTPQCINYAILNKGKFYKKT